MARPNTQGLLGTVRRFAPVLKATMEGGDQPSFWRAPWLRETPPLFSRGQLLDLCVPWFPQGWGNVRTPRSPGTVEGGSVTRSRGCSGGGGIHGLPHGTALPEQSTSESTFHPTAHRTLKPSVPYELEKGSGSWVGGTAGYKTRVLGSHTTFIQLLYLFLNECCWLKECGHLRLKIR